MGFVWNESFFRTFSICTVNLCYFKVLTLELDCVEELCSVPNLLHLTELKSQTTVEDFHRPMLVIARAWNQMFNHRYVHSDIHNLSLFKLLGCKPNNKSFSKHRDALTFQMNCWAFKNSNMTFSALWCPDWWGKCPAYHNVDGGEIKSALLATPLNEKNLRCLRENDMTCITQLPAKILVRLSVMLPFAITAQIDQRPIRVAAAAL